MGGETSKMDSKSSMDDTRKGRVQPATTLRDSFGSQQSTTFASTISPDFLTPTASTGASLPPRTSMCTSSGGAIDSSSMLCDSDDPTTTASQPYHLRRSSSEQRRPPGGRMTRSTDSARSGGGSSSARSSFATEFTTADRAALGKRLSVGFKVSPIGSPPLALASEYHSLGALDTQAPVPLLALQLLWGSASLADTHEAALQLEELGALRLATLDDGSVWAMPNSTHVTHILDTCGQPAASLHAELVAKYTGGGAVPLADVLDDGYIQLNLLHHLLSAGDVEAARQLLLNPHWLEQKLLAYGSTLLVADFRRYLQDNDDPSAKLVLHALQMAMAACLDRPMPGIVSHQMLARLIAVAASHPDMQGWHTAHMVAANAAIASALRPGPPPLAPAHLLPCTATLGQAGGLQRMTLRGHKAGISRVVISPNGGEIVTASADGTAQVWDVDIGDCMLQLAADHAPMTALAISPDGTRCVTGSQQGVMFEWDIRTGAMLRGLQGHSAQIHAVVFDPQARYLLSASADGTACVWADPAPGPAAMAAPLHTLTGHAANADSAASMGAVLAVATSADGSLAATASDDFTARIWSPLQGNCIRKLSGHTGWVVSCAFAPGTPFLLTASHDATLRVWNAMTGVCRGVLAGHTGRVNKVVVAPDGRRAVSASDDFTARVWDVRSRACVSVLAGHSGWVADVAISATGDLVVTASGDTTAALWDAASGECLKAMEGHSGELTSVALTPKGRFAVTGSSDGTARVWDMQAPLLAAPDAHHGRVRAVQVLPGRAIAATIGEDCVLRLWGTATGECVRAMKAHTTSLQWLHLARDGGTLVSVSGDRRICRWAVTPDGARCGCAIAVPEHHGSRVKSVAIDGACTVAAVVLFDSTTAIWDLRPAPPGAAAAEPRQLIRRAERDATRGHSGGVNGVAMSGDGARVLTVSKDCTARLWDTRTCETLAVMAGHRDGLAAGAFSADGRLVATASFDGTARVWWAADGMCAAVLRHARPVATVVFSPGGDLLLTVTDQHCCYLWDVASGAAVATLAGHRDVVHGAIFSPDGAFAATYSEDCTILVWRCSDGCLAALFLADAAITSAAFATPYDPPGLRPLYTAAPPAGPPSPPPPPDGGDGWLVVGDASGMVHFLDFPSQRLSAAPHAAPLRLR